MTIYVCKTCGRALRSEKKPSFCYADRTTNIENISDEDAVKMQLFSQIGYSIEQVNGVIFDFEFPGDVKYHPYSGETLFTVTKGFTLSEYQDEVLKRVRE